MTREPIPANTPNFQDGRGSGRISSKTLSTVVVGDKFELWRGVYCQVLAVTPQCFTLHLWGGLEGTALVDRRSLLGAKILGIPQGPALSGSIEAPRPAFS